MDLRQLLLLTLQMSIVSMVFSFGLRTTLDDLLYVPRRPGLLLRSVLAMLLVMPVLAVVLTELFELRPTVEIALVALALSPMPPLLPKREVAAGGHQSYAVSLMATMAVLAIVVIPLAAGLLAGYYNRPFSMTPMAIARIALVTILLPLTAGAAVRTWQPGAADRLAPVIGRLATILLGLGVLALLAASWRGMWAAVGDGTLLALTAFVAIGLLVGHLLGGPEPENAVVLALSTACRHPAIALTIASANFPDERFGGTILVYLILGLLCGVPYLAWRRRAYRVSTESP